MGAPAARASELAQHWARAGHEVSVMTGFPNHPTGVVPPEWRSRLRRLTYHERICTNTGAPPASRETSSDSSRFFDVFRTWLWPLPNRKAHERIRNYVSFCLSAAFVGPDLPKPDVVIGTSPQLLCAFAAWWLALWKRVPFVFEVRDLWPESLAAVGAATEGNLLYRTIAALAGFLYSQAERIVVVTPAFKKHLIEKWQIPAAKIAIVENGVETDLFRPDPAAAGVRKALGLDDHFLIGYTGTIGAAQGLETLIAAAEELQAMLPNARFLFVGEGARKQELIDLAARRNLSNLRFLGQQPHESIPAFISAADLCMVTLKRSDLFRTVIPTKLLECMSCARAVVVAVDGEARQLVEEARAGLFVEPGNGHALAEAIRELAPDVRRRIEMGMNGRQYIVDNLSRESTARDYLIVLSQVLEENPRAEES